MFAKLPRLPALQQFAPLHSRVLPALPCWGVCRRDVQPVCFSSVHDTAASQQADQLLTELCSHYGIQSAVRVAQGTWGLGLYHRPLPHGQHGSMLPPAVPAQESQQHGQRPGAQQQLDQLQHAGAQLLVSVPLCLVLSCSIPGCSPQPQQTPPALHQLLHNSCCSSHWEMQVAALLMWALRQPADSWVGGFWQRYVALIPPLQQQASLLLWSKQQLEELQDIALQETAEQWQREVHAAFHTAVQPCFQRLAAARNSGELQDIGLCNNNSKQQTAAYASSSSKGSRSSSAYGSDISNGAASSGCTLEEWLWAVAAVESRAFGVSKGCLSASGDWASSTDNSTRRPFTATGSSSEASNNDAVRISSAYPAGEAAAAELVGMVPVLDLANHTCRSACHHTVHHSTATFNLFLTSSSSSSIASDEQAGASISACTTQSEMEVLITYGEKDNRQLMEQYGFCVDSQPFDRIQFERQQQQQQQWMSHTQVKEAAKHVRQQLVGEELQKQQQQQGDHLAAEGLQSHEASCSADSKQQEGRGVDSNQQSRQSNNNPANPPAEACGSSAAAPAGVSTAAAAAAARVDAVVASIIAAAGWRDLRQYKQVTAGSTVRCAEALLQQLQALLGSYCTSIAEDEALLQHLVNAKGLQGGQPGGSCHAAPPEAQGQPDDAQSNRRLLAAVRYRLGQKLLLDAAQRVLQRVVQQCSCK